MPWNWELPDWPHFIYDSTQVVSLEKKFFQGAGGVFAILKHFNDQKRKQFIIEILSEEGLKSAEIEGEILERESLQSSIRKHFGLVNEGKKNLPSEQGMGELMWEVYNTYEDTLSHEILFKWHQLLMRNRAGISDIGGYRTHQDPMQIISGRYDKQIVYFEAPPSNQVFEEMEKFINWYNDTEKKELALVRAAVAHVYFESIHPFEDGNGRIGRAIVEKALSQSLGQPTLIAASQVIARRKKEYYKALATCNKTLEVGNWVKYFAEVIVQSQEESLEQINFLMAKSRLMNRLRDDLNDRQEKVLLRMFSDGVKGFSGGLSAEYYISITKASKATATRDLTDLVEKGALYKTGKLRHTRYWLSL